MRVKKPFNRIYKGIFYSFDQNNKCWYCDLFDYPEKNPFDTQKEIFIYINDYINNMKE